MTFWAMCLFSVSPGHTSICLYLPFDIFEQCNRFKVIRVDAASVVAKVIHLHTVRYWAYELCVTKSMRVSLAKSAITFWIF